MATETVLVRPRRGLILDGIPRKGALVPAELAEDWIANQLVERVEPAPQTEVVTSFTPIPGRTYRFKAVVVKPVSRQSPKGSGATRPAKRRRT